MEKLNNYLKAYYEVIIYLFITILFTGIVSEKAFIFNDSKIITAFPSEININSNILRYLHSNFIISIASILEKDFNFVIKLCSFILNNYFNYFYFFFSIFFLLYSLNRLLLKISNNRFNSFIFSIFFLSSPIFLAYDSQIIIKYFFIFLFLKIIFLIDIFQNQKSLFFNYLRIIFIIFLTNLQMSAITLLLMEGFILSLILTFYCKEIYFFLKNNFHYFVFFIIFFLILNADKIYFFLEILSQNQLINEIDYSSDQKTSYLNDISKYTSITSSFLLIPINALGLLKYHSSNLIFYFFYFFIALIVFANLIYNCINQKDYRPFFILFFLLILSSGNNTFTAPIFNLIFKVPFFDTFFRTFFKFIFFVTLFYVYILTTNINFNIINHKSNFLTRYIISFIIVLILLVPQLELIRTKYIKSEIPEYYNEVSYFFKKNIIDRHERKIILPINFWLVKHNWLKPNVDSENPLPYLNNMNVYYSQVNNSDYDLNSKISNLIQKSIIKDTNYMKYLINKIGLKNIFIQKDTFTDSSFDINFSNKLENLLNEYDVIYDKENLKIYNLNNEKIEQINEFIFVNKNADLLSPKENYDLYKNLKSNNQIVIQDRVNINKIDFASIDQSNDLILKKNYDYFPNENSITIKNANNIFAFKIKTNFDQNITLLLNNKKIAKIYYDHIPDLYGNNIFFLNLKKLCIDFYCEKIIKINIIDEKYNVEKKYQYISNIFSFFNLFLIIFCFSSFLINFIKKKYVRKNI